MGPVKSLAGVQLKKTSNHSEDTFEMTNPPFSLH